MTYLPVCDVRMCAYVLAYRHVGTFMGVPFNPFTSFLPSFVPHRLFSAKFIYLRKA